MGDDEYLTPVFNNVSFFKNWLNAVSYIFLKLLNAIKANSVICINVIKSSETVTL